MEIDISKTIAAEATKFVANFVLDKIKSNFGSGMESTTEFDTLNRVSNHLNRVLNWASTYNFLGLGLPKDSEYDTIPLRFDSTPRRFRATGSFASNHELNEDAFLQDGYSVILLGDPGAGKTTTIRRIALSLLIKEAKLETDTFRFPLLLLLKELPRDKFICEEIADVFGLQYDKILRNELECDSDRNAGIRTSRADYDIRVEGIPIEDSLAAILNATRALILIDGLDELASVQKSSVEYEIEDLNTRLTHSKIIISCRSGDYNANFHGFRILEILPLNQLEITKLAHVWLDDPTPFLQSLQRTPYADIVDRPLLLSFLLYLFGIEGELPEQPSLIYRKVVYRLLKEWDEERRIHRGSRYAHFDPDRKIDFLSELAYHLTYEIKGKIFSEKTFLEAYGQIHSSFNLPLNEYIQVASEIETHTGVMIASGIDTFEFAHLSIQEYLCANYICRSPFPDLLKRYLTEYPAPVAVACALSSNPSMFFVEMINRHLSEKFRNPYDSLHGEWDRAQLSLDLFGTDTAPALKSFLSRLKIENPFFKSETRFGECILCMFAFYYRRYSPEIDELLVDFLNAPNVLDSLRLAVDRLQELNPQLMTDKTAVFHMDAWFRSIYESVAGPWPSEWRRAKVLPLVLFPKDDLEKIWNREIKSRTLTGEIKQRVSSTIGPTPFCLIENGGHTFNLNNRCSVCDFSEQAYRNHTSRLR